MKKCVDHHYACQCREQKAQALLEVAKKVREILGNIGAENDEAARIEIELGRVINDYSG